MNYFNKLLITFVVFLIIAVDMTLLNFIKEGSQVPFLPLAVALDCVLILPILCIALSGRKLIDSWMMLPPLMLVGYLVSKMLLNAYGWAEVKFLAYIIFPLELLFVYYSIRRMLLGIQVYKTERQAGKPVYDSMLYAIETEHPLKSGAAYLVHELSMYYYAFFAWKKRGSTAPSKIPVFTYHKDSSIPALLIFLGFVLTAEGFAVHLLVMQWSEAAAWVLTAGNVYIMILFSADYRAMIMNPVTLEDGIIKIRYGLRGYLDIRVDNLESIKTSSTMEVPGIEKKASVILGVGSQNVRLECLEPVKTVLMFGKKKSAKIIYLALDEPASLQELIESLHEGSL